MKTGCCQNQRLVWNQFHWNQLFDKSKKIFIPFQNGIRTQIFLSMMLIFVQWKDLMIEEVLPAIFAWNDLIPFIFEEKIYWYSAFIFLYIDLLFIWFCELNPVPIDQFLWSTNVVLDLAFWSWWFSRQKLSEHPWQRICDSFFLASNTNCSSRCCCHEWKSW